MCTNKKPKNMKPNESKATPEVVEEDVPEKDGAVDSFVLHHVVVRPHPEHCLTYVRVCVRTSVPAYHRQAGTQAGRNAGRPRGPDECNRTRGWESGGPAAACALGVSAAHSRCGASSAGQPESMGDKLPWSRSCRRGGPPHSPLPPYASHITPNAPTTSYTAYTRAGTLVAPVLSAPHRRAGACSSVSSEAAIQRRRAPRPAIRASCSSVLARQVF